MLKRIWNLISRSFIIWGHANASRMSAALTYYTMLSLAPLLMIAIAIAGYIYDSDAAQTEIVEQVRSVTTEGIANTVAGLIQNAVEPKTGLVAGTISLCVLVFGASGVFTQLYDTFNDIWDIPRHHRQGWWFTIQKRLLGVGMVLIAGLVLLGALAVDSSLAYLNQLVEGSYPKMVIWLNLADRSLSYLLMPIVFSVMFWFFPATKIHWSDVWPAGILTAVLVAGSRYLIGLYLDFSTASEVYGAAGSLVVLLIWVYMTGLVVFYGAAFSHAWADSFGSRSDFHQAKQPGDDDQQSEATEQEADVPTAKESPVVEDTGKVETGPVIGVTKESVAGKPLIPTRRTASSSEQQGHS